MKFMLLTLSVLVLSACSSKPVAVKEKAQELYANQDKRICPDVNKDAQTRKEAAYCLGWIYIHETDKKLPVVDQLAFRDVTPGDPVVPYIWVAVSSGLMAPLSPQEFGSSKLVTKGEWENSVERLEEVLENWKTRNPQLK